MKFQMQPWIESLQVFAPNLSDSTVWLRATNVLCLCGCLASLLLSLPCHAYAAVAGTQRAGRMARLASGSAALLLLVSLGSIFLSVWHKGVEVNHFPSQTMSEVLVMFALALLVSQTVLHFALGLARIGPGWAMLADGIQFFVFLGAWGTSVYSSTLTTAQRDLPPALQSYWFPFHLSSLIFSYATLGIAAIICFLYFAIRLWGDLWLGKGPRILAQLAAAVGVLALAAGASYAIQLSGLGLLPALLLGTALCAGTVFAFRAPLARVFGQGETLPVWMLVLVVASGPLLGKGGIALTYGLAILLALVGLFFLILRMLAAKGRFSMPSLAGLMALERDMDQVSFRAFSIGFPFLTAGLFMGAFWAQEAWANYWGWDSKENSALITWLIYVIYIHLRMLGGYRGAKAMSVLMGGAISVMITFQLFGYLPDSQKSLHRYTDDNVVPQEGMQGEVPSGSAKVEEEASTDESTQLARSRS